MYHDRWDRMSSSSYRPGFCLAKKKDWNSYAMYVTYVIAVFFLSPAFLITCKNCKNWLTFYSHPCCPARLIWLRYEPCLLGLCVLSSNSNPCFELCLVVQKTPRTLLSARLNTLDCLKSCNSCTYSGCTFWFLRRRISRSHDPIGTYSGFFNRHIRFIFKMHLNCVHISVNYSRSKYP